MAQEYRVTAHFEIPGYPGQLNDVVSPTVFSEVDCDKWVTYFKGTQFYTSCDIAVTGQDDTVASETYGKCDGCSRRSNLVNVTLGSGYTANYCSPCRALVASRGIKLTYNDPNRCRSCYTTYSPVELARNSGYCDDCTYSSVS